MFTKKHLRVIAPAGLIFGVLVAAVHARAETPTIKVALHWNTPFAGFIPYYVAINQGYYKDEGLAVELAGLSGSGNVISAVSNGDSPLGQAGAETIISAVAKGAALKAVFLLYQKNPNGVIVYKDSGIKSFKDLRGKTISMSVIGSEGKILDAKLREAGLDPDKDLKLLNVAPGARLTMMLTGQADAVTGFIDFQYIQAEMAGKKVDFLPFSTPERPIYGHAVIVNSKWLDSHKEETKRFVRATMRGLVWSRDHVDEAVDYVVKWDPTVKIDRDFVKRDWQISLSELISGGVAKRQGIGHMEAAGWGNLAAVLGEKIDANAIYTNEFIPADAPKW